MTRAATSSVNVKNVSACYLLEVWGHAVEIVVAGRIGLPSMAADCETQGGNRGSEEDADAREGSCRLTVADIEKECEEGEVKVLAAARREAGAA